MVKPPLQLETYYFTKVAVSADPCYEPQEGVPPAMTIDTNVGLGQHNDDLNRWMVTLGVHAKSPDEKPIPYKVDLEAVGFFRVDSKVENEKASLLVQANGAAILYSAAREYLLTITGRGPWPPITLPTTNFLGPGKATENRAPRIRRKRKSALRAKHHVSKKEIPIR
jgi:preprotein translocase subunit SecB